VLALSLLSSLLLLLLLGALLVLAHADGAAWVRAALVRDLVCRTSCPICSSVICWAALICSACAKVAAWSSKLRYFWPASRLLCRCFLHLSLSPFQMLLLSLLPGREGGGEQAWGALFARDLWRPKQCYLHQSRTTPQG